jgi:hypothetical protein
MANTYRNSAGQNPEDVYDADVVGDGPVAAISNIGYRNAAGVLLKFAALKYGTAAANHGYRLADGRDFSALWCKKGTAVYSLPFDGANFSINSQTRGGAYAHVTMKSDGTFSVYTFNSGGSPQTVIRYSGTWLPSGESVANWSVQYDAALTSESSMQEGYNYITNGAPTVSALTTTRDCEGGSNASLTGSNADANGYISVKLYRLGVLRSTSRFTFNTNVNGN